MLRRQVIAASLFAPAAAVLATAPAGAAGGKAKQKSETARTYLVIPTLTASIQRPNGVRGVITVEAGLDVPDPHLRGRAELSVPRLRAAYVAFLQSYVSGLNRGAPVNADYLVAQFQRRTDDLLGAPGARFLVGSILMN